MERRSGVHPSSYICVVTVCRSARAALRGREGARGVALCTCQRIFVAALEEAGRSDTPGLEQLFFQ